MRLDSLCCHHPGPRERAEVSQAPALLPQYESVMVGSEEGGGATGFC